MNEMRNKLLILYLSCGAGHRQAALALQEAAQEEGTWDQVERLDVVQFYEPWFRWAYHESYLALVRHAPFLANRMWKEEPVPDSRQVWTFPPALIRRGSRRFFDFIEEAQPTAVISTEIAACELLALLPEALHRSLGFTSVATIIDFGFIDPVWLDKRVDTYCVPTPWEEQRLRQMGVPAESIRVTGIPVARQFTVGNRESARRELGLPSENPVVLFMAGGMTGKFLIHAVRASLARVNALHVVLAGSNRRDAERFRSLKNEKLRVVEWTDRVSQWMLAADFLVSKPGGMTLAESMATGTPQVLFHPLGCWEHANLRFAVQSGTARAAGSTSELAGTIFDLLQDRRRLNRMRLTARQLASPGAARRIVRLAEETKEVYALAR